MRGPLRSALLGVMLFTAAPAWAEDALRELWTGKLYSSTFRAGVCVNAEGDVRGVLLLRLKSGKVDIYHFEGKMTGDEITARHSSGHKFRGNLTGGDAVAGEITLKNGMRLEMRGRRTHGVPLAEDTCRPPGNDADGL